MSQVTKRATIEVGRFAPGELATVQAFINTADLEAGRDQLCDEAALHDFLVEHSLAVRGLRVSRRHFTRAVELREALRQFAASNNGVPLPAGATQVFDRTARDAQLIATLDSAGRPTETAVADGVDGALGELLAIVLRAVREGSWARLKACREHGCRWAFYDDSRNRSGTWCTMALCGSRAKMRAYRARRR